MNKTTKPAIYFNSVFFTPEGITKHAREEAKELQRRGYKLFITDTEYKSEYGDEFRDMYNPIDKQKEKYIHYCIQPPLRHNNIFASLAGHMGDNNTIYFLAFESNLPVEWVNIINQSKARVVVVPSTYNKKLFLKSGIKKEIEIMPHGVSSEFSYSKKEAGDGITTPLKLLWAGTVHNQRKNLKGMWQAWTNIRTALPLATLTLKVSGIYGCDEINKLYLDKARQDDRVTIIDSILSDDDVVTLFQNHHIYISPHLSEGFGIHMLEALATGTPTIASSWGGNSDFTTTHCLNLDSAGQVVIYQDPYYGQIWDVPAPKQISDHVLKIASNYDQYAELARKASETVHQEYSWESIIDTFEKIIKQYGAI